MQTETKNEITGDIDGIDNDNNGYVDDVIGYDFINEMLRNNPDKIGDIRDVDCDPFDEHGHGTQVASVISSVAPDAKIMVVRTHNSLGQSECHAIANGIIYAVLNGANVINLSSGETDPSPMFHSAIKFANAMGCVIVASAGNRGDTRVHYPSDHKEVISVGGVNEDLRRVFN